MPDLLSHSYRCSIHGELPTWDLNFKLDHYRKDAVPIRAFYDKLGNNVDTDPRLRGVPKDTNETYAQRLESLAIIWHIAERGFKNAGQAVRRVMKEVKKSLGR